MNSRARGSTAWCKVCSTPRAFNPGRPGPKLDWCDVADLVRVSLQEVAELTAEPFRLTVKIAPGLPLVKMDFVLMVQALTNLLVNAATHTPAGTLVEIGARIEGTSI